MKIGICCVGKVKEAFFRQAAEEYQKRLGRYCRLEILQVADEKTPEGASEAEEEEIRRTEAQRLLRVISKEAYVIALVIDGKRMDSPGFARQLENLGVYGKSHVQFVIGGSLGLHDSIRKRADLCLSFSDMTFPHQLMRVVLLEQIYRAYRIINGEPYHK